MSVMSVMTVFYIILLLSASALCIALILYIGRITKSVKEIENDIKDLSYQVKPLITSTTNLSEKLNQITDRINEPIQSANDIVVEVRERVDQILHFEEKLRTGIEKPALELFNTLSAISNGVRTFWNAYVHKFR
jgi:uncharacterized protein YoxC